MKKVPLWIRKAILASQVVYCADARNKILDDLISGKFDIDEFNRWCHNTYNVVSEGKLSTASNYFEALELSDLNTEPASIQRIITEHEL